MSCIQPTHESTRDIIMCFFTPVEGRVLLRSSGVFREATLFRNDGGELFAKYGSGFIRLMVNKGTSAKAVSWSEIRCQEDWAAGPLYPVLTSFLVPAVPARKAA
jgi:hypothetical protein